MDGNNTARLATVLSDRMKKTSNAALRIIMELGTYNIDKSITPDNLRARIPKGDYMINFMLSEVIETSTETVSISGGAHGGHEGGSGHHEHNDVGEHSHRLPEKLFPLKDGDRILIAWCGNIPVVIAKVVCS